MRMHSYYVDMSRLLASSAIKDLYAIRDNLPWVGVTPRGGILLHRNDTILM